MVFRVSRPAPPRGELLTSPIGIRGSRSRARDPARPHGVHASLRALREAQMELAHVNRVTTMGQLAASIAHEIKQPLTGVVANADAGLRWLARQPPNVKEAQDALDCTRQGRSSSRRRHQPDRRPRQEGAPTEGKAWRSTKQSLRS